MGNKEPISISMREGTDAYTLSYSIALAASNIANISNLEGKILTFIDAMSDNVEVTKARKDIVKDMFYNAMCNTTGRLHGEFKNRLHEIFEQGTMEELTQNQFPRGSDIEPLY